MNTIRVRKSGQLLVLCIVLCILGFIGLIAMFGLAIYEGQLISRLHELVPITLLLLAVLILLRGIHRWELTLNSHCLTYTPLFGPSRNISYYDIQKVCIGGRNYILYTSDGKKLLSFEDSNTQNASKAIHFLEQMGVKLEI